MNDKSKALRPDLNAIEARLARLDLQELHPGGFSVDDTWLPRIEMRWLKALLAYIYALEDEIETHEMGWRGGP